MLLKTWRARKALTIAKTIDFMGLKSPGAYSDVERGISFPTPETIVRIRDKTDGAVTADDHMAAWESTKSPQVHAAGRAAARAHLSKPGKRRK